MLEMNEVSWRKIAVTLIEDFELKSVLVSYFPLAFSTPSHRPVMCTMAGLAETDYRYSRSQNLTLEKTQGKAEEVMDQQLTTATVHEGNLDCGRLNNPGIGCGISLYGLPCARCKAYYAAELTACPVCKSTERVSAKQRQTVACVPTRLSKKTVM
jgi:hypothetical protein